MQTTIAPTQMNEITQSPDFNISGLTGSAVLSALPQTIQPSAIRPELKSALNGLKRKAPVTATAPELPTIIKATPEIPNPETRSAIDLKPSTPTIESRVAIQQPITTQPITQNVNLAISEPAIEIPTETNTAANIVKAPRSNFFQIAANNILSFARRTASNTSDRLLGKKSKIETNGSSLHEIESQLGQ